MDALKLNKDVLGAVRQNIGAEDEEDDSLDSQIAHMGPMEVFQRYLEWNGIIGYANSIWAAIDNIRAADKS